MSLIYFTKFSYYKKKASCIVFQTILHCFKKCYWSFSLCNALKKCYGGHLINIYSSWNYQKTVDFMLISRGIEADKNIPSSKFWTQCKVRGFLIFFEAVMKNNTKKFNPALFVTREKLRVNLFLYIETVDHFRLMFPLYTPWKHKTWGLE